MDPVTLSVIVESQDPIGLWNFMTLGSAPPPPEVIAAAAGLPLTAAAASPEERFRRQADGWGNLSPEQFQAELDAYRGAKMARGSSR